MLRYRQGKWKKMRVIDAQPVVVEVRCREVSVVECIGLRLMNR